MLPVDLVILAVTILIVVLVVTGSYALIAGVPFVPTPVAVAQTMIGLARLQGSETIFDLGAGDGRILIEAKRAHPGIRATGVELGPTVWLLGKLRIFFSRQRIPFLRRNALAVDLRSADVIFLYLSPSLMNVLEEKFDRELRPGTVVISHAFRFSRRTPVETTVINPDGRKKTVLRYEW